MSARRPMVSAIVPAFNAAPVVGECIASILEQSYPHIEVIVVDDGSTDETPAVVGAFDDERVRYVHQANAGRGAARNRALSMARGTYVAVCDADDISLPDRFEREVAYLEAHPDVAAVSGQVLHFSEGRPPRRVVSYPTDPGAIHTKFARGVMGLSHAAAMIRLDVLERLGYYCEECLRAQDLELFLRIHPLFAVHNLPDDVLLYRNEPTDATWSFWKYLHYFHEYARYRAARYAAGEPAMTFDTWKRTQIAPRIRMYSVHLLRYVKHALLPRISSIWSP